MRPRFQFHLSTALAATILFGFFLPAAMYYLGAGNLSNVLMSRMFIAGAAAWFIFIALSKKGIREPVSAIMFLSVFLGSFGFYLPTDGRGSDFSGQGVPISLLLPNECPGPNLMAPFNNIFCVFIMGVAVLIAVRLVVYCFGGVPNASS